MAARNIGQKSGAKVLEYRLQAEPSGPGAFRLKAVLRAFLLFLVTTGLICNSLGMMPENKFNSLREVYAMIRFFVVVTVVVSFLSTFAQTGSRMKTDQTLPAGYWPLEKSQAIIDKAQTIRLAPNLSQLSADERKAVAKLLEVGKIFQGIYEDQRHKQALSTYRNLNALVRSYISPAPAASENLLTLYRLNHGPIV